MRGEDVELGAVKTWPEEKGSGPPPVLFRVVPNERR
jgi:hypothetical protein